MHDPALAEKTSWIALNLARFTWPALGKDLARHLASADFRQALLQDGFDAVQTTLPDVDPKIDAIQQSQVFADELERIQSLPIGLVSFIESDSLPAKPAVASPMASLTVRAPRPVLGETMGADSERAVAHWSDRDAVVVCHQDVRWSNAELNASVDKPAAGLLAIGLESGRRVDIWSRLASVSLWRLKSPRTSVASKMVEPASPNKVSARWALTLRASSRRKARSWSPPPTRGRRSLSPACLKSEN